MILQTLKQIAKHSFIYSLNYVVASLCSLLLLPVYTRYLSRTDYGSLALIDQSLGYLGTLFFMGGAAAVARFYNDHESAADKRLVITTGLWMALLSSSAGALLLIAAGRQVSSFVVGDQSYYWLVYLLAVILITESLFSVSLAYLSARRDSRRFLCYGLLRIALGLAGNFTFVVGFRLGVVGMIYGQALSNSVMALVAVGHVLRLNGFGFDRGKCKAMIRYGLPLAPATVLATIVHNADQYLVKYYTGLESVGIYSLGYKIAFAAYSVLTISVNLIWGSAVVFDIYKHPDARQIYARLATYIMSVITIFLFCVSVFSDHIIKLLASPQYYEARRIVPVICLGLVAYGFHLFLSAGVLNSNKTWMFILSHGAAAAFNLVLNVVLTPRYGYLGAAWASVSTYYLFALVAFLLYRRVYAIPFQWGRLASLLGGCVVLYLASAALSLPSLLLSLCYKGSICLALPVLLYHLGFLGMEEKEKIREWGGTLKRNLMGAMAQ